MDQQQFPGNIFLSQSSGNNISVLQAIADEYPYCSLAQFTLLSQQVKENDPAAEKQRSKTALYFNDPAWLYWQLHLISTPANTEEANHTISPNEQIPAPAIPVINTNEPAEPNDTEIAFEPLYTVDYFASQGIKISEETVASDKLGKQMKSFTEWLKTMKKIDTSRLPSGDDQTDIKMQHFAENSNAPSEVITEALAEVLIKQDKPEAAMEMYKKLSLLDPSKSAYFAAKIDSLQAGRQV
ncbi:MAG: hypothetical protein H0W12_04200 [Chitinophagaceae bacterium]|nr:hypothetical protein [Chitinophagaceae bacterium]